jgi:hypothetical protein
MNGFVALAQAAAMPPPPSPQANHPVGVVSIVLVVFIVLGSVAMIALSSRRLKRPFQKKGNEPMPPNDEASQTTAAPPSTEGAERAEPEMLARLRRVTAAPQVERRRMGNRKAKGPSGLHETPTPPSRVEQPQTESADADESIWVSSISDDEPEPPLPEPIPIRRGAVRDFRSEGEAMGDRSRRASGTSATIPGLTAEEVSQLETPRSARGARGRSREQSNLRAHPARLVDKSAEEALKEEFGSIVRELLFCSNVGELLHGFALYSDAFLFRTMDDTGLNEEEFRAAFRAQPAKQVKDWTRLAEIRDLERHADNMATVTAVYAREPGMSAPLREQFRFVKNLETGAWLIDDIQPISR